MWTQLPGLNTSDLSNGSEAAEAAPPMLPAYIAYTSFILFRYRAVNGSSRNLKMPREGPY